MSIIYKIVPRNLWEKAEVGGVFTGAPIDLKDGYIHFLTAQQVAQTAALHFAGQDELLLMAINGDRLGGALKYEPSRSGDLFPHLYADLRLDTVLWVRPMPLGEDGAHVLPDLD